MLPVSEVSFPYLYCSLFGALSAFFRYEDARWRILQPRQTRKRKILWSKHRWPWYMTPRRGNEERKLSSVLLLFSCCCLTRRDEYVYVARASLIARGRDRHFRTARAAKMSTGSRMPSRCVEKWFSSHCNENHHLGFIKITITFEFSVL